MTTSTMAGTYAKNFAKPDETRTAPKSKMDIVTVGDFTISYDILEPGWNWRECIKPIVGGDSCQVTHTGYLISGRIRVRMNDGVEAEYGPGDVYFVAPGHEGWVLGEEPAVGLEFASAAEFGKSAG